MVQASPCTLAASRRRPGYLPAEPGCACTGEGDHEGCARLGGTSSVPVLELTEKDLFEADVSYLALFVTILHSPGRLCITTTGTVGRNQLSCCEGLVQGNL